MALDPNIALGVRPLEVPNQLAQYAQVQQLMGAQRQAEISDMQLEALRRDRDALDKIQAAIIAKGGPPDLAAAADEMIRSGKPEFLTQGMAIRQKLADQLAFTNYQKEFAPGAAPTGMPAPAAGSFAADTAARRAALPVNAFAAPGEAPVNALAPAAAPAAPIAPVNAMVGQPDITALEARYRRVANLETPGAKAEAALLLKQIDRAATATPADIKTMQALGYPITQAGFRSYRDAQRPDRLLTPEEEAQKLRIARAGASSVNLPPQEKAEQGDRGKLLVKQYEGISETARIGARTLPSLESNAAILDKGFDTGFGTEAKAAGAKVLGALGVKDAQNYATSAQTFLGNASSAILQKQLEQKGPQTESDAQRITQTGAQLGNTKEANKFFIDVAKEQIKRDIDQRNFYDKWWEQKKTYDGAENAWYSGEGGKSLFDRPGLKRYINPTSNASQIPGQGPAAPAARNTAPAANVITNPQFPGFSIGKP